MALIRLDEPTTKRIPPDTFSLWALAFRPFYLLAALFGAIGGPLAFFAGERLDAVVFPQTAPAIVVLAVGWAAMFPLLMWLSQRYDGFAGNVKPSLEAG